MRFMSELSISTGMASSVQVRLSTANSGLRGTTPSQSAFHEPSRRGPKEGSASDPLLILQKGSPFTVGNLLENSINETNGMATVSIRGAIE